METPNFGRENLAFTKSAVRMGFDALSVFTRQAAVASDIILGATPAVPEEGKKAVGLFFMEGQKGLESLKMHVERSLDLDWTAKNAPVKNLEEMESLYNDAFDQIDELRQETKPLLDKATKPLPREAKSLFEIWNESVNSGFEFLHNYMNKNFELAKKAMNDVSAFTPSTGSKAAR